MEQETRHCDAEVCKQEKTHHLKSENSIEKVFHELETHSPEYFRLAPTAAAATTIRTVQSQIQQQTKQNKKKHQMHSDGKQKAYVNTHTHNASKVKFCILKHIPFFGVCV